MEVEERDDCPHPSFGVTKVIDKLGPMTEHADGKVYAHVITWHWVCRVCGATLPENPYANKEET